MKYYFYILECNDKKRYYGHTNNLIERLNAHNKGGVQFTRDRGPMTLVYFEDYSSRSEAFKREQKFKNGKTRRTTIEKLISKFNQEKCQGFNSQTAYQPTIYVVQKRTP